ncbi:hypothetical protein ABZ584_29565 [Streptomyces antibioticus]|uniref:hypothetical protein n=1 Tax=Streptomyces antibioticus TaxID=1890 RepID=UPI0033DBAA58
MVWEELVARYAWADGDTKSIPEIARRASADGGEFFSVYRDVNARYQVMHMERTMGVPVDPAWFDTRLRTVLLASPGTLFENLAAAWSP